MSLQNRVVRFAFHATFCCFTLGLCAVAVAQPEQSVGIPPVADRAQTFDALNGLPIVYIAHSADDPGAELRSLTYEDGTWRSEILISCPDGWISDSAISPDATTVVFAMKRHSGDTFHLYSYYIATTAITQLTRRNDVDDTAPVCLPNSSIIFVSTRDYGLVPGTRTRMPHLYRMNLDGSNIHRIGAPGAWEDNPVLLPDGRVLYERAEGFCQYPQALWAMFPSGTKHARYWQCGDTCSAYVTGAHPIGMTAQTVCLLDGVPVVIDRESGFADARPLTSYLQLDDDQIESMPEVIESVFPIDEHNMLCAGRQASGSLLQLFLANSEGFIVLPTDATECASPVPILPKQVPALYTHRTYGDEIGTYYILYAGMENLCSAEEKGDVAAVRIIEYPPIRSDSSPDSPSLYDMPYTGWNLFNEVRILGDVPVETDGSAYFTIPPEHMVLFQYLDSDGRLVYSMTTPTMIQPGETTGILGCDDASSLTPPVAVVKVPDALHREPSQPSRPSNIPEQFQFTRDIQPIFTAHCLRCHDTGNDTETSLSLSPDRTLMFSVAYEELWRKNLIAEGASDSCVSRLQPFTSTLLDSVRAGHQSVRLVSAEIDMLEAWIACYAPFYETPQIHFPEHPGVRSPLTREELTRLADLCSIPVSRFIAPAQSETIMVNFDRPERSGCLRGLSGTSDDYLQALDIIETGRARLYTAPVNSATHNVSGRFQNSATLADEIESQFRSAIEKGTSLYDGATELVRQPPGERQ